MHSTCIIYKDIKRTPFYDKTCVPEKRKSERSKNLQSTHDKTSKYCRDFLWPMTIILTFTMKIMCFRNLLQVLEIDERLGSLEFYGILPLPTFIGMSNNISLSLSLRCETSSINVSNHVYSHRCFSWNNEYRKCI